jgi:hypothetical protein
MRQGLQQFACLAGIADHLVDIDAPTTRFQSGW